MKKKNKIKQMNGKYNRIFYNEYFIDSMVQKYPTVIS